MMGGDEDEQGKRECWSLEQPLSLAVGRVRTRQSFGSTTEIDTISFFVKLIKIPLVKSMFIPTSGIQKNEFPFPRESLGFEIVIDGGSKMVCLSFHENRVGLHKCNRRTISWFSSTDTNRESRIGHKFSTKHPE